MPVDIDRRFLLGTVSAASIAALAAPIQMLTSTAAQAATEYPDATLTLSISTPSALITAVNNWNDGDYTGQACVHFVLASTPANGTPYGAITITAAHGSDSNRLVIRSAAKLGARFSGKVVVLSPRATVWGLTLDAGLEIGGNGSRALRNKVRNGGGRQAILITQSNNCRVAFNDVGSGRAGISVDIPGATVTNPRIDHNLIEDMWDGGVDNNLHEPIQLGESKNTTDILLAAKCEYNLIRNVPKIGDDNEGISVKCSNNIIRYNNLLNSQRYITNRNGRNNVYRGNLVDGSLGIAIRDRGNSVISNLIRNTLSNGEGLRVLGGDVTPANYPANGTQPCAQDTLLAVNKVDKGIVGDVESGTVNARATTVERHMNLAGTVFTNWNNPIIRQGDYEQTTSFSSTSSETWSAPPQLTLSDVGPNGVWVA